MLGSEHRLKGKEGKNMLHRNYRSSGIMPVWGICLFVIVGLVGSILIETIYVYCMGFLPNLFLRVLMLILRVAGIGYLLTFLVHLGKLRNPRSVRWIALALLFVTFYMGRCVYAAMAQGFFTEGSQEVLSKVVSLRLPVGEIFKWAINPVALISALGKILPYGLISVNGVTVKGVILLILWLIECGLLLTVPYFICAYYAGRPYDEDLKVWYNKREEWPAVYVANYREIRTQMRKGNCAALLDAMKELKGYHIQGQESYAIVEFYLHGKFVGPYVSLTNVKAVQSGPRSLDHRLVTMCRMFNIGTEAAQKLYEQVSEGYGKKATAKGSESQKLSDKISMAQFNMSRVGVNVATEIRRQGKEKDQQYIVKPAVSFDTVEFKPVEDISIHVPRVTPEMEKAYLEKQKNKR